MKHLFSWFLLVFLLFLFAGYKFHNDPDLRSIFLEAESYFLFEEFNEALPLYLQINREMPENDNVNYRIGRCYLNSPFDKDRSISYLEKAANNITTRYRENNFRETQAPVDAVFYLASAYHINNKLDLAVEHYKKFIEVMDEKVYDKQLVEAQIQACENAKTLQRNPVDFDIVNLGDAVNTRFSEINPVVSGDESILVYVSQLQFYDAVFVSRKVDGRWSNPVNIIPELGVDGDVYPTSLSHDGTELYFYRSDEYVGNIYMSKYQDGRWSRIRKLNDNINTRFWESHASITSDGKTLYFSSNRSGGYGGLDIYKSNRLPNGEWGPATNLGPIINTRYNEDTPFITSDGKTLYFSSHGHYNMGGYDIFYSNLMDDNTWSVPMNIGYPLNTTDDDLHFAPVNNGRNAYISKYFENEGFGGKDIYRITIYSDEHPRKYTIPAMISLEPDVSVKDKNVFVTIVEKGRKDTITIVPNYETGDYSFDVPAGEHLVIVQGDDLQIVTESVVVDKNYKPGDIKLNTHLIPVVQPPIATVIPPEEVDVHVSKIDIRQKDYYVTSDEPVRIRMQLERDAQLIVSSFVNGVLTDIDTIDINRRRFTYAHIPVEGENVLDFKLVDKDNIVSSEQVKITYQSPEKEEMEAAQLAYQTAVSEALKNLIDKLILLSDGDLKNVLENIDATSPDINSIAGLLNYLNEQSEVKGYDKNDISELVISLASLNELHELKKRLTENAESPLKNVLRELDIEKENIFSGLELIKHLKGLASIHDYTEENVIELLTKTAAGDDALTTFIESLAKYAAKDLQTYLSEFDVDDHDVNNPSEFIKLLFQIVPDEDFIENDIISALIKLANSRDIESYKASLQALAKDDLKQFLENLNLQDEKLGSNEDLLRYILNKEPDLTYSRDDVHRVVLEDALNRESDVDKFLFIMRKLASDRLREYLEQLNPEKENITSPYELVEHLYLKAEGQDYSSRDVLDLIGKLAFDGNIDNYIARLKAVTTGDLHNLLYILDPVALDLHTLKDLVEYLLEQANNYNYNEDDVIDALVKLYLQQQLEKEINNFILLADVELRSHYNEVLDTLVLSSLADFSRLLYDEADGVISATDLLRMSALFANIDPELFVDLAISLSDGDLNNALVDMSLQMSKYPSISSIVDELINVAEKRDFSNSDIYNLLLKIHERLMLEDFIRKLERLAENDLKRAILGIDIDNENISTIPGYMKHLADMTNTFDFTKADIAKLLSDVLAREDLLSFIARLTELAEGDLKKVLSGIDIDELGIKTIADLIDYLLEQAKYHDYTEMDLLELFLKLASEKIDELMNLHEPRDIIPERKGLPSNWYYFLTGFLVLVAILVIAFVLRDKKKKTEEEKDSIT